MKDYLGYTGKVCVVTGAASGMGKATAEMLVDLGAMVYALDWAEVKVEGITAYLHTDLSKKESIDAAFAQIPDHIDCYFGIAGVSGLGTDFLTTTKIDLISNKYISECILTARMTEGGAIAYMTSTAGIGWEQEGNKRHYLPVVEAEGWDGAVAALEKTPLIHLPGNLGYSFSKLAMNYLVAKQQALFAARKIRVNAVLPGSTDTGLKGDFLKLTGSEEMAMPIVFQCSDMASYLSGDLMVVDYGSSLEVEAGIRPNAMAFTFDMILEKMAAMHK